MPNSPSRSPASTLPERLRQLAKEMTHGDPRAAADLFLAAKGLETAWSRSETETKISEGWKLLKDTSFEERSFPEDLTRENGNYYRICWECLRQFQGHKRRPICKVCSSGERPEGT